MGLVTKYLSTYFFALGVLCLFQKDMTYEAFWKVIPEGRNAHSDQVMDLLGCFSLVLSGAFCSLKSGFRAAGLGLLIGCAYTAFLNWEKRDDLQPTFLGSCAFHGLLGVCLIASSGSASKAQEKKKKK